MTKIQAFFIVFSTFALNALAAAAVVHGILPYWIGIMLLIFFPDSMSAAVNKCLPRRGRRAWRKMRRALWHGGCDAR